MLYNIHTDFEKYFLDTEQTMLIISKLDVLPIKTKGCILAHMF